MCPNLIFVVFSKFALPRFKSFVLQPRNRQTHAQVVIPYESQKNNFIFIFLDLHVYKWLS